MARADTARQTFETTGWTTGAGLWVNYAFTLMWIGVAVRWPFGASWARRAWIAMFLFMAINAAIVFTHGPSRWLGGVMAAGFGLSFFRRHKVRKFQV